MGTGLVAAELGQLVRVAQHTNRTIHRQPRVDLVKPYALQCDEPLSDLDPQILRIVPGEGPRYCGRPADRGRTSWREASKRARLVVNTSHQILMDGPSYRPRKRPGRRAS
jgi:hypothetical protein